MTSHRGMCRGPKELATCVEKSSRRAWCGTCADIDDMDILARYREQKEVVKTREQRLVGREEQLGVDHPYTCLRLPRAVASGLRSGPIRECAVRDVVALYAMPRVNPASHSHDYHLRSHFFTVLYLYIQRPSERRTVWHRSLGERSCAWRHYARAAR